MKTKMIFLCLCLMCLPALVYSQLERVIVETYYVADSLDATDTVGGKLEAGSVTYRVYVDLKPGSRLKSVYGDANHALKFASTKPFFNNIDGQTYAKDIKKAKYLENTVALDTWLTLGQTSTTQGGKTYFGILKRQDTDGSFIGGVNNDENLLANTAPGLGIPLTDADGMDTLLNIPTAWSFFGVKDFITGIDSTIFGSVILRSSFSSNNVFLKNSGAKGVIPDSNQILIAQLTTKGELTFELNLEVEQLIDTTHSIVKYVANDSILLPGEKISSYLKYPFPPPVCGCKDPAFLEYDANLECDDNEKFCKNRIVFGCVDKMACNFDPKANFSIPSLCCYPGSCAGRDISVVCPVVRGDSFDFSIYPNPASSSIFLNVISGVSQEVKYSVVNSFGIEILNENLGSEQRIVNHEINLASISDGLYLIRVNAGDNFLNKQFFKKQE